MRDKHYGFIHIMIRWLLYPWTSRVRLLNQNLQDLQSFQREDGQIIFVGQGSSFIDLLVINEHLRAKGMEPITFAANVSPFLLYPLARAIPMWADQLFKGSEERLAMDVNQTLDAAAQGGVGYVALKNRSGFTGNNILFLQGFFGRLAEEVQRNPRPIRLSPASVFLTRGRKKNVKRTIYDILFRSYDVPGRMRKVVQLIFNYHKGGAIFSRPIDLQDEVSKGGDRTIEETDKRLRWALLFHLNNEDRAYRGPLKRSKERKVRKILKERRLNEELKKVAERSDRSLESVLKEADKTLHDIASDTNEGVINLLRILFDYVWARTLEGIDVHQEDLDRIRELNKQGPVIFVPCHRSHVDYLVVGHLFEKKGLHFPRIAAGDNLSKWPLGPVLRRAGAFFIRRSFKGETIFPLVFDAYIRHLLRENHVIVFFPEGGRSRTGKLLHPKMGMMSMIIDAWRQGIVDQLPLVPVTIDYGKVFEGDSYLREKSGLPKQKENLASVLRSRKVLKKKHGYLRLRFGDAIYLDDYAQKQGLARENLGFKNKVPFIHNISYEIIHRINGMVTITAGNIVAGLLMGNPKRGMMLAELKALFVISCRYLRHRKVELAFADKKFDIAMNNAIDTFVQWETVVQVEVAGATVINIPEQKRPEMEYYKNNGLHFILDLALFCTAWKILHRHQRTLENILEMARDLYQMLNREFLHQEDYPQMEMMQDALQVFVSIDALRVEQDGVIRPGDYDPGMNLVDINAHMLLNFLESYFVVAEVVADIDSDNPPDRKAFLKQCMTRAKLLFAVGSLSRSESINHVSFGNAADRFGAAGWLNFRKPKAGKYPHVIFNQNKEEAFLAAKKKIHQWLHRLS